MTDRIETLVERDARHQWHPYTQHALEPAFLPVVGAKGAELELGDGRVLIDAISSWWTSLHGHGEPALIEAMATQAETLDHVLFAGTTHEPAVALGEEIAAVAPEGLSRIFFSDNGSTAVEVALKMAFHRHVLEGASQRRVFVALEGSYHGDTFGAMAIGDPDPFFEPFAPLLFRVVRVAPEIEKVVEAFESLGDEAAGMILEPRVQGAGGMLMHSDEFLRGVRRVTAERSLPLIADEVMTGFGRTGSLFACLGAGIAPDLMCLAKGLTGGIMPMAATLATEAYYEAFLAEDRRRAFFHGHSFTAHPIGCAVARASLELTLGRRVPERLDAIGARIEARIVSALGESPKITALRRRGGIVAFDLVPPSGTESGYLSDLTPALRARAVESGVLLRPLGNVVYAMPPACLSDAEADRVADVMVELTELV
ncbi:MAG: adenosylmethionine--8-amino-7-oxononanoate transaminase [Planctomycetota bacterium]|jgi:adenosylmethionine-8-amino-7-oxononanoate aminotransferase